MVLASVVVLGDIGRSPRMQYHSNSLLMQGYDVEIIGYGGSKPIKELCDNKKVTIRTLKDCPQFHEYLPRLTAYILKTLWQAITLFLCLIFKRRSHFLLVQTPPAIPTLAVCWIYCVLHRTTYIIDWHNYAFKNMALSLGDKNKLVRMSHWFEGHFGRKAEFNLCVTKAMKDDLKERWNIVAAVLYDRPFDSFSIVKTEDKHSFFRKICKDYPIFADKNDSENSTKFTTCLPNGSIILKEERPALLISSTSWTEDEDFSVLFTALQDYDKSEIKNLPNLICVITGKGPLKGYYNGLISKYNWKRVKIITPWLESEDYPIMLGCADLGVSLHMSTSGLDLPMKVVDMFGCGLPVAAYNFPALKELVRQGENGTVFTNSTELSEQLQNWFKNFPNDQQKLKKFRDNIKRGFQIRWHENWMLNALPLFEYNVTSYNKKS